MWIRDRLHGLFKDEDFEGWFPCDGRPGLSPAVLALVSVLQFAENLTDRQAARAVGCRIDWKYCLGMGLGDAGFGYSVLSEFRDRIAEGDRAGHLLELMVERLVDAGLLSTRGKVRTDSTHVLAAVRTLNRPELVTETLRLALEALAESAPAWLEGLIDADWGGATAALPATTSCRRTRTNWPRTSFRSGLTACESSPPSPRRKLRPTSSACPNWRCCGGCGFSSTGPTNTGTWPGGGRRAPKTG